jgi:hypothetical protein
VALTTNASVWLRPLHKGPDSIVAVVRIDPLETFRAVVKLEVGGLVHIEPIKILDKAAQSVVHWILYEMPIQALVVVPLLPLTEFNALEDELFSGMRPHPRKEHPHVGELLPCIAWHFFDERPLFMDHLVVAEHENEMLVKCVDN